MSLSHDAVPEDSFAELSRFRGEFSSCLTRRADARFELTEAVLCADGPVRSAETAQVRDRLGRVTSETTAGRVLTHAYDAVGRPVHRTTPSGAVTTYAYDAAGHRTLLTAGDHSLDFTHDAIGRETARRIDNTLTLYQSWDVAGRLREQHVTAGSTGLVHGRAYTYRSDGHLTGVHDHAAGPRTFDLDLAGRVTLRQKTRLSRKPDTWRYTWDTEDHLTSVTTPDPLGLVPSPTPPRPRRMDLVIAAIPSVRGLPPVLPHRRRLRGTGRLGGCPALLACHRKENSAPASVTGPRPAVEHLG